MIKIVTDSTSDLTNEEIEKYGITVVPLTLVIDGESYLDRFEISPSEFMQKMASSKELPKSSQPSAGAFKEVYDRLGEDGSEVISIHMTGKMSGTVRSAESAADLTDTKVTVIDSGFISRALAYQVIESAKAASESKSSEEIVSLIKKVKDHSSLFVVVDTLENLVKGGRIGKGRAFLGSLLNIKPIASLAGGEYTPVSKARNYNQVAKYLITQYEQDTRGKKVKEVSIVHADGMPLAEKVSGKINEEVFLSETTPVISTHTGKGAIGFMYYYE
ncbi:DegV family protein [Jeotgalibacillus terrae]|uniref:DegV family protein n=1 Tax=Jeotgalibacillus terrae TaxID=587735 RepID=A0ABW5ZLM3_9BACL|nr:DegV family protein [Jeotgalibacillus terrae]MBM7577368.1 DegV family protein with EDD domain [Jeotgalibacillus terrae]